MTEASPIPDPVSEVESWLRASLPDSWVNLVDHGRSPGPPDIYEDFNKEEWLAELFGRRLLMSAWPTEYGGLGWSPEVALSGLQQLARYEVPLPLYVTSQLLAGSGLLEFGTPEQRAKFLPGIVSFEETWCQLFSEPEAGSDLAALRTQAVADGDHWVVSGQKVWTTWAHFAKWGLLLARTGSSASLHGGISCFILSMNSPGVDVRPLLQMTGEESFNEVFMDDVMIDDSMRLGPVDGGWVVARSILQAERGELGQRRVGGIDVHRLLERHRGTTDPRIRQMLIQHYARERVLRWMAWRGYGGGLEAQVIKLMRAEANMELQEMALNQEGPSAIAYDGSDLGVTEIVYGFLRSRANSIAGGTSEIMRNVIGERLLGLPRDPRPG